MGKLQYLQNLRDLVVLKVLEDLKALVVLKAPLVVLSQVVENQM